MGEGGDRVEGRREGRRPDAGLSLLLRQHQQCYSNGELEAALRLSACGDDYGVFGGIKRLHFAGVSFVLRIQASSKNV